MATIQLNQTKTYKRNETSKYWKNIKCEPQEVKLDSTESLYIFHLKGIITDSYNIDEIGKEIKITIDPYKWWVDDLVKLGVYSINN